MSNHDASKQALGYFFQLQCALLFLMESADDDIKICVEKFDDISFHKDDDIVTQLMQLKYHSTDNKLTNSNLDFWRTLKVWIDEINKNSALLENTKFYIITTNSIGSNSVIEKIKNIKTNDTAIINEIYEELKQIATAGKTSCDEKSQSYKYYSSFLNFNEKWAKFLIKSIVIIPDFYNPKEVDNQILKQLKLFTNKNTEKIIHQRLLGWWFDKMILCLENSNPTFISFNEIRHKISSFLLDLREDILPIDVTEYEILALKTEKDVRNIVRQMELINSKEGKINIALQQYYKAYAQRSKWIKESLIYSEELDNYDQKLTDEWNFQFTEIKNNLEDGSSEIERIEKGRELYRTIMNKDIPIRFNLNDNTISRGSYNGLSNELKIGWHPDFKERLNFNEVNDENLE